MNDIVLLPGFTVMGWIFLAFKVFLNRYAFPKTHLLDYKGICIKILKPQRWIVIFTMITAVFVAFIVLSDIFELGGSIDKGDLKYIPVHWSLIRIMWYYTNLLRNKTQEINNNKSI